MTLTEAEIDWVDLAVTIDDCHLLLAALANHVEALKPSEADPATGKEISRTLHLADYILEQSEYAEWDG